MQVITAKLIPIGGRGLAAVNSLLDPLLSPFGVGGSMAFLKSKSAGTFFGKILSLSCHYLRSWLFQI